MQTITSELTMAIRLSKLRDSYQLRKLTTFFWFERHMMSEHPEQKATAKDGMKEEIWCAGEFWTTPEDVVNIPDT